MSSVLFAATVIVIFLVLLACISFAIEQTEMRRVNPVLASVTSALCILAMLGGFGSIQQSSLIEIVLIPWAALGISILFIVLLCFIRKICPRDGEGNKARDYESALDDRCGEYNSHMDGRSLDSRNDFDRPNQGALTRGSER